MKQNIEFYFGNNPLLDILHIAYKDFSSGKLTSINYLRNVMLKNYPNHNKSQIINLIQIVLQSGWFLKSGRSVLYVQINERGVEVYIGMVQNQRNEKRAIEAKNLIWITIIISISALILSLVQIFISLNNS